MNILTKLIIVLLLLSIQIQTSTAYGETIFNELISFAMGGTESLNAADSANSNGCAPGGGLSSEITKMSIDFDQHKYIYSISQPMNWKLHSPTNCGQPGGIDFGSDGAFIAGAGIYSKFVPVIVKNGATEYGRGTIGWQKDIQGKPRAAIYLDTIDTAYADTLSGRIALSLEYDTTVFTSYIQGDNSITNTIYGVTGVGSAELLGVSNSGLTNNKLGTNWKAKIVEWESNTYATVNVNNYSSSMVRFNVTKNNFNFLVDIHNTTSYTYYNVTSTANIVNEYIPRTTGVLLKLQDVSSGDIVTRTIVLPQGETEYETTTTGSILFNKSGYNLYEDFNVSWNINNIDSTKGYYIQLVDDNYNNIIATKYTNVASGNTTFPNAGLPHKDIFGYYSVYLYEWDENYNGSVIAGDQTSYGGGNSNITDVITGNFTILNTAKEVNKGGLLNIKYNLSSDGQISFINCKSYLNCIVSEYEITKGTNSPLSLFIPTDAGIGGTNIWIEYYDIFVNDWITLYDDIFYILPESGSNYSLLVDKDIYYQGDTVTVKAYYTNTGGYVKIINPDSVLKQNYSLNANTTNTITYKTTTSDKRGTWSAALYDNTGVALGYDSFYLDYGIPTTPSTSIPGGTSTNTTIIPGSGTGNLLDAGSSLSEGLFGSIDGADGTTQDGDYSETEIKSYGNKWVSVLILIVACILIIGTYNTMKGKRRE